MQRLGLKSVVRAKTYRSYRGEADHVAPNLLNLKFEEAGPGQKRVTELNVNGQKLYLSPVMDLYNDVMTH